MLCYARNSACSLFWKLHLLLGKDVNQPEQVLRKMLSRNPRWISGHKALATIALQNGNTKLAYCAAHCFLSLAMRDKDKALALSMLAQCYTASGNASVALNYFEKSCAIFPPDIETKEHIAAAHILAQDFKEAEQLLTSIGEKHLTPQAKAALKFAKSKLQTSNQTL
jgi:Tfp pilus assembly protein PilF